MRRSIERKRDGQELGFDEWMAIARAYMAGSVDDAQMAALCMACVWRGMSFDEAYALTRAMVESGERITFENAGFTVVDKHSSGGVSDIVSLASVPLAAACGAHVAKVSGRALGHTGGTIDKLETIPGLRTALSIEAFVAQVLEVGCAIVSQSDAVVPLDHRLYKLRDLTASVPSLGLIAASIVCKKVAGGAHAFVFDVKTGAAAFMQDPAHARDLAHWLMEISARFDRRAVAFVTDMSEPLGRYAGTGLEVCEARDLLAGQSDERARELVVAIASALVAESGAGEADALVNEALRNGSGLAKFEAMIAAQGGNVEMFRAMRPGEFIEIAAPASGYVGAIDVVRLGHAARALSQDDALGGLRVMARIGDYVEHGAALLQAFGAERDRARPLAYAFTIVEEETPASPLIYDVSVNSVLYRQSDTAGVL